MYAIVQSGGKQVKATPGQVIKVETLAGEVGDTVEIGKVVAVSNDEGQLLAGGEVADAKVTAVIESHGRGKKIIVFKFKRRKMYRRRQGHRQNFTAVKIDAIAV
jgi:large subunit ribosomal protein L21